MVRVRVYVLVVVERCSAARWLVFNRIPVRIVRQGGEPHSPDKVCPGNIDATAKINDSRREYSSIVIAFGNFLLLLPTRA